jgi:hypothetical protein
MQKIKAADILTINIDIKILPYVVQDIANLIGLSATLSLVDHYKGRSMWIPAEFKPDHVLCKIIGPENAVKLIDQYHGETIEIPKCDHAIRVLRNQKIIDSDKSQSQLATEWNLTVRQIRNIQGIKNIGYDERQESLFN